MKMHKHECTSTTNNTRPGCARKRAYFLTSYEADKIPTELPNNASYLIMCDDECKNGKWHAHAFIYFKNAMTLKAVQKIFGTKIKVIPNTNNYENCIKYIKGEIAGKGKSLADVRKSNIREWGEAPMMNGKHRTVAELKNVESPDELDWRMYSTWRKIKDDEAMSIELDNWHKDIEVYYIHGESGRGKSERAKQLLKELGFKRCNIIKYENGFYNGIPSKGTDECAIYDDWRDSHMKPSEFINLIDYNRHTMNIKGGSVMNNYKCIVITTVQRPNEIYRNMRDDEPRKQWERRMKFIDMGHDLTPDEELTWEL